MCLPYGGHFYEHFKCINSFNPNSCVKNFFFPDEELGMAGLKHASGHTALDEVRI